MNAVVNVESKGQFANSFSNRHIFNNEIFVVQLYIVLVDWSINSISPLKLGLVVDRSSVEEDLLMIFHSKVAQALEVGLSFSDKREIQDDISYF